jgi:hypothetical protein
MAPHQGRTALYRLYDQNERLMYIGITANPTARWARHAEEKDWWPRVSIREVEWFSTRAEAEVAECAEIGRRLPPENRDRGVLPATYVTGSSNAEGPGEAMLQLVEAYGRAAKQLAEARDAATAARESLEREAISVMRSGWSPYKLAKFLPWGEWHVRKLARANGIEPNERYRERAAALRKPTPAPPAAEES